MSDDVPAELDSPINRQVLDHVWSRSAHSDLTDELARALEPLGEVKTFCADSGAYRSVVAATNGIVFAVAVGMATIGLRLDERMRTRAVAGGAGMFPECGPEWVSLILFRADWPAHDLVFWARHAYVAARAPGT